MAKKFMKNPKFAAVALFDEVISDNRILEGDKYAPFVQTGQLIEVTPEIEKTLNTETEKKSEQAAVEKKRKKKED